MKKSTNKQSNTNIILSGVGLGNNHVTGRVRKITYNSETWTTFQEGDILVTDSTNITMIPLMEKAGAIVVVDGGLTSHAAIVGLNLGKATIISAADALKYLRNGDLVRVEASTGNVCSTLGSPLAS